VKRRVVACPSCRAAAEYSERNPYRPFCSARCRGVDLGAWASEDYRVSASKPPEDQLTDSDRPPNGSNLRH
jgi:hypothetical protein